MANPGVVWVFRMEVDPQGVNHVVVPYTVRDLGVDVSGLVPFLRIFVAFKKRTIGANLQHATFLQHHVTQC